MLSPSRPDALAGPNVLRILQLNMSCLLSNYSHLYCDLLQDANFSVYAYIYMVRSTKYEKLSGHVCSAAVRCSWHCSTLHSLLENIFSESSYSAPQVLKVDFRHTTWHSVSHRVGKLLCHSFCLFKILSFSQGFMECTVHTSVAQGRQSALCNPKRPSE